MTANVVQIQDMPLALEEKDVWRCLGSRQEDVSALTEEVARMSALGQTLVAPAAVYRRQSIRRMERNGVYFEDGPLLEGKFLAHCFEGAREAVFLVVTVGQSLEARVSELFAEGKRLYREGRRLARLHLERLGASLDRLTRRQSAYLGVPRDGPFKPEHYRY